MFSTPCACSVRFVLPDPLLCLLRAFTPRRRRVAAFAACATCIVSPSPRAPCALAVTRMLHLVLHLHAVLREHTQKHSALPRPYLRCPHDAKLYACTFECKYCVPLFPHAASAGKALSLAVCRAHSALACCFTMSGLWMRHWRQLPAAGGSAVAPARCSSGALGWAQVRPQVDVRIKQE